MMRIVISCLALMVLAGTAVADEPWFRSARPVWPKGEETTLNCSCRFRREFTPRGRYDYRLRVASAYIYRVKFNGEFAGFGPARAAPGFFRVDEWNLTATNGVNLLEIEAFGPNCECFYFPKQTPFLQAELSLGDEIWVATGEDFPAFTTERLRKVPRFAAQRHFMEVYRYPFEERMLELALQPEKRLLPREYSYPAFAIDDSFRAISREHVEWTENVEPVPGRVMGPPMGGSVNFYPPAMLEANPYYDVQHLRTVSRRPATDEERAARSFRLQDGEAVTFRGEVNRSGFARLRVRCEKPCRLYLTFDELLGEDGSIDIFRLTCANTAAWFFERPGSYEVELVEPYAFKYARLLAVGGEAEVTAPSVRAYESPDVFRGTFECSDPALAEIFKAAQRTLAANGVDCVTDCPTRERAGWCGDTFFGGKACAVLTGDGALEKRFLSNWLMPGRFDTTDDRVQLVPAVYPADLRFRDDTYIPNFALWFVLEIEDYVKRTGDREFALAMRRRLEDVMAFFRKYENADGLLEKLPFWVFVEWSRANELVQDVNYPSSMHYAAALDAMDRMYDCAEYAEKAKRIRAKVREQSWTGEWFCDNAVRQPDGSLKLSGECTECCQYFAMYFGVAPRAEFPELWQRMLGDFGPGRDPAKTWPKVHPANFIFGRCIRAELLSAAGEFRRLCEETRRHFLPMAELTGTLWEHDTSGYNCSCCHGLASVAAVYLVRDVLGVREIDPLARTVRFEPDPALPLEHCAAEVPLSATAKARFACRRAGGRLRTEVSLPDGWKLAPGAMAVTAGGAALRVEEARCSAMPVNIRWPGHQRERGQTEICTFARFDCRGRTEVRVTPNRPFTNAVVRPVSAQVAVTREDGTIRFTVAKPGAYSVEFDGRHGNLMLFADPPHDWSGVDRSSPKVRYYGPGEHEAGVITLRAGETLFLDEGAVVYGRVFAEDAPDIRICGTGILDASRVRPVPIAVDPALAEAQRKKGWAITNVRRFDTIRLRFCDNARIEGITIRDSLLYAVRPICCDRLTVDNVKIVGSWRYNSDGIDMHNCRGVRIRDSFIRTYDDSICVKGFDYALPEEQMLHKGVLHDVFEDVLVERCTIWNDWGRALEIGAETRAREIRGVTFRDCDLLAFHDVALDVQNCDQAYVHDIVYENIRVEYDPDAPETVLSASAKDFRPESRREPASLLGVTVHCIPEYSKEGAGNRGRVSDVTFRDIDVYAPSLPQGGLRGFDAEHRVERVAFDRIRLNGQDRTAEFRAAVFTNDFASLLEP